MKETEKWYSWYPGMEDKKNTMPHIIQYDVTLVRDVLEDSHETVKTTITLSFGEVMCSGHFIEEDNSLYDAILEVIYSNEERTPPKLKLSDYNSDFDLLVILERKILKCI